LIAAFLWAVAGLRGAMTAIAVEMTGLGDVEDKAMVDVAVGKA